MVGCRCRGPCAGTSNSARAKFQKRSRGEPVLNEIIPRPGPRGRAQRMARRSAGVGRRPIVIQIPSGSVTLAIQPWVVDRRHRVGRAPSRSRRRYVRSSDSRLATPIVKSRWSSASPARYGEKNNDPFRYQLSSGRRRVRGSWSSTHFPPPQDLVSPRRTTFMPRVRVANGSDRLRSVTRIPRFEGGEDRSAGRGLRPGDAATRVRGFPDSPRSDPLGVSKTGPSRSEDGRSPPRPGPSAPAAPPPLGSLYRTAIVDLRSFGS